MAFDLNGKLSAARSAPGAGWPRGKHGLALVSPDLHAVLAQMQSRLDAAELMWEACVAGNSAACVEFSGQAQLLYQLSGQLERDSLQALCGHIDAAAAQAVNPERAQGIALDMPMALLLLRRGLEDYPHGESSFQEQGNLLDGIMQAGLRGASGDETTLSDLVSLYCKMEAPRVATGLAAEMRKNLRHIEEGLNIFFLDTSKRKELPRIAHWLRQIHGGLHILSLNVAGQLVLKLHQVTAPDTAGQAPSDKEKNWIVCTINLLNSYLHDLELGQQANPDALNDMLEEAEAIWPGAARAQEIEVSKPAGVSVRTGGEDEELLEIFLEEADEVLENLRCNLASVRDKTDGRDTPTAIRRAFHTLKGSARMVGLKELGEVAWAVERVMNKWLHDNKPIAQELMEMVESAEVLFRHWVEMLHDGATTAVIDARPLLAWVYRLENVNQIEVAQSPMVTLQPSAVIPATVVIGAVSLSPLLFNIATTEAADHVRALQKQWATLRGTLPPVIPLDFMRSAHTLAGVNRTLGFAPIEELALALELWLEERIGKAFVLDAPQIELLEKTISCLDEMCAGVRNFQAPSAQTALIGQLHATREIQIAVAITAQTTVSPEDNAAATSLHRSEEGKVNDEIDEQLLPIFLDEASDLYPQICHALHAWRLQVNTDSRQGLSLQRSLHTLKGSARMAGAMRLGALAHRVEERIDSAITQSCYDATLWNDLQDYVDRIGIALEELDGRAAAIEVAAGTSASPALQAAQRTLKAGAERVAPAALLRVRSDAVDRLVNQAGEVSAASSRVEMNMRVCRNGLLKLTDSMHRLHRQLREAENQADGTILARINSSDSAGKLAPQELDRFTHSRELMSLMSETVHDVQTMQQALLKNISATEAILATQEIINRELQQGLLAMRMAPFASVSERLYRVVRQTAKELGKRVNLQLSGTDIELDRSVLGKMTAPFEHLLRNAIGHGLEAPEQRAQAGKAAVGEIRLSLHQESNEVVFEFSDDGAGLDMARLKNKALEQGLINAGDELSEELAVHMIFQPGLSTAQEITEIAGRGVGLDVVKNEVSALGGYLDVASTPGAGMKFTIHLPLAPAVT